MWGTGSARRGARVMREAQGFTLVEVLVVVAIIVIALGVVVVNLSGSERTAVEDEARRLALLLEHARDEALVTGASLVWVPDATGYRFLRRDGTRDRVGPVPGHAGTELVWAVREWRSGASVAVLQVAGVPVSPGAGLLFSSSGFNPPYALELGTPAWRIGLTGDVSGKVRVGSARAVQGAGS